MQLLQSLRGSSHAMIVDPHLVGRKSIVYHWVGSTATATTHAVSMRSANSRLIRHKALDDGRKLTRH